MLAAEQHGPVSKFRVWRAVLGRSYYHTAAYWVDGLLVDSGCAFTSTELAQAVSAFPLQQIVNTHCHEDHIGANSILQQTRGAAISAHPLALPILASPRLQPLHLYRRIFWGWPKPSQGNAVGECVETEHHRFQVLHTPGHSPDHICLYEPQQGWLFSGDAYIGGQDKAARPDYDIWAMIDSLKRLAALPLTFVYPGSGTVRSDPKEQLQRKVAYLEELGESVQRLHDEGLGIDAISRKLLGPDSSITYLTLGHFTGANLVRAYLRER